MIEVISIVFISIVFFKGVDNIMYKDQNLNKEEIEAAQ